MRDIRKEIRQRRLYFDGGYGTVFEQRGFGKNPPETLNLSAPQEVTRLHEEYIGAGCDILTTNTFGVNSEKYENYAELIRAAVSCAKRARENFLSGKVGAENAAKAEKDIYIAFDIGPTGKLLEPIGELSFERAVKIFSDSVKEAVKCGVDLFIVETMNDSYETKAAVLAVRENSDLPVFVTNAYDKNGRLMTGADPLAMITMLEGLGADALGLNCSFGPDVMLGMIEEFTKNASLPIIVSPNAGLPKLKNGRTFYDVSAEEFSLYMQAIAEKGAHILGGCCGTMPEYIALTVEKTKDIAYPAVTDKNITAVSSYTHAEIVGEKPLLIGERLNPTGKPKLKEALKSGDMKYILEEGLRQTKKGAHILDVNVGLPGIDEKAAMREIVRNLQGATDVPLQLDSPSAEVLESAMRIYNGKPLINSVNGDDASMSAIFPLVKKYGGTVIALTMDKDGIPETAMGRAVIAEKIIARAAECGVGKKDIVVDPLCMAVSSDAKSALVTLETLKILKSRGIKTSLGVSNVSFGLPEREKINAAFFTMALACGLDMAIMNPLSAAMTDVYYAYRALSGTDASCGEYIKYVSSAEGEKEQTEQKKSAGLKEAVVKGLRRTAIERTEELLKTQEPMRIIDEYVVPALREVGEGFERKKIFLPQLMMSADAAAGAFEKIKENMPKDAIDDGKAIVLATVQGDIHDIGKNIVKVLLESYGFKVYDLGKNVPKETVLQTVRETGCKLVGLSALMTTTIPSMEETIKLLKSEIGDITVIVGGAVLTADCAKTIGADAYCADAMDTVRFLQKFYAKS